ncbi:MAG: hypothetical protein K2K98_04570 [Muribaculaceae bacterium]|nr:hypothetical protein [Muribaculaceae bacterium]
MNRKEIIDTHKVFPLTYLRTVALSVRYDKLENNCYSAMSEFVSSSFGIAVTTELYDDLQNRPLSFGTEDQSVVWTLDDNHLEVLIGQDAYQSFETSLLPLVKDIQQFLKAVGRQASDIKLNKVNLIPVTLSSYDEMKDNASHVFTDIVLDKWGNDIYQKNETRLVYLLKEQTANSVDFEIFTGFISKGGLSELQPARYIFDITAKTVKKVTHEKLVDVVRTLNNEVFRIFIHYISEELINSMEEG